MCIFGSAIAGAEGVTYLARYLCGGPIKNARLVAGDGDRVTCTYRTSAEEEASGTPSWSRMTLSSADFLQRWLRHAGPQTRVVRSYGLYHHTHATALGRCRVQVGQPPVVVPVPLDWQTACAQRGAMHPERCPACGQLLVCTGVIPRGGAPPPPSPDNARHESGSAGQRRPERLCVWRSPCGVPARFVGQAWCALDARQAASPAEQGAARAGGRRDGVRVTRHKLHSAAAQSIAGRIGTRSVNQG